MKVADEAYNNGEGRIADGSRQWGDTLAEFIRREITEVIEGVDMSQEDAFDEAARVMRVARAELDDVVIALENA